MSSWHEEKKQIQFWVDKTSYLDSKDVKALCQSVEKTELTPQQASFLIENVLTAFKMFNAKQFRLYSDLEEGKQFIAILDFLNTMESR